MGIMVLGYARNSREEKRLIAAGIKPAAIYLEGRGAETLDRVKLRQGELLVTVGGLRALGNSRREMAAQVRRIHDQGGAVKDVDTGERSDRRGAEMLDAALARIHGERTMPDAKVAVEMQRASVRARLKGRMGKREALVKWRDPTKTVGEAIREMPGWSAASAYRELGPRGLPSGRRGKKR